MTWMRDVVYKLSRTGLRTDPCGTPNGRFCMQDSVPDMLMRWCLSENVLFQPTKRCARTAKMSMKAL